ncbi:flagellar hook-length control protein FliK [uncultured Brachyspira sp.]|uniref:flagellar hook-length control protein FliK n=1 Tax=uncultured Brachyspira sp. TaxID=221953 RepID=UPI002605A706|nr:flagellar hook-length control protein FliK [uncultured Brachyspira sp.]
MINGLGNLLSFADNNVSSNNNNAYSLNNYNYDDSFAKMLNENQSQELYSQSVSNKVINNNTENDYKEYNNNYNDYSAQAEEKSYSDDNNSVNTEKSSDNVKEKSENTSEVKERKAENTEDNKKTSESEKNEAVNENNNEEKSKEVKENTSEKDKLAAAKEKAKQVLKNVDIKTDSDKKIDIKENINRDKLVSKEDKKENIKNEDIENIKKEIESLNAEELDEDDKKELSELIESLEELKNMIDSKDENSKEDKKVNADENTVKDDIKIKDIEKDSIKEIKTALKTEINNTDAVLKNDNTKMAEVSLDIDAENKYADRYNKDNTENKSSTGSSINNTISDDKGAELTIINMKDSAEGANLKGYNHYNNVSKTHNSPNLSDSIIRFQDLMGKLVEKAQVAVTNGKSEVLMTLNPEHLGKVRLKINMDGDNLVGKIFVDNAEVKDIFTKNLDTVISSLNEIGINIEGFDVMLRQDMPNNGEFGEELNNNGTRFGFENNENVEEVNADIKTYIVPERKLNLLI